MKPLLYLCALAGIVCFGGCGQKENGPAISGSVLLDDKPLANARVHFMAVDKTGSVNSAKTGANGKFTITPDPRSGRTLTPGSYKVLISKLVDAKGDTLEEEDAAQQEAAGKLRNVVPPKYNNPDEGVLNATIKAGVNQLEPFQLKSK